MALKHSSVDEHESDRLLADCDEEVRAIYRDAMATMAKLAAQTDAGGYTVNSTLQPWKEEPWKAEMRYRALVERIPAITFVAALDTVDHELYVSPQIEGLLGFSQSEWLENPFLWFYQIHPDDRERWVEEMSTTWLTGADFRAEYRMLTRTGSIVWLRGECQIIRDDQGQPQFLQGIAFDITASKEAEEVLRRSQHELEEMVKQRTAQLAQTESRMRAIVETAVDGIITIDERGKICSFNPAATRIFGYTPEEVLGSNVNMLMPNPFRAQHDGYLSNYLRGGSPQVIGIGREVTGLRKDGSAFPMDLAVSDTLLGDRRLFTGLVRDISERKQNEAMMAEMHKKLMDASRQAGMAEVATGVLHNVGNVLNSVNVSSSIIAEGLRNSKIGHLSRVAALIHEHEPNLGDYLTSDSAGKAIPRFLARLAEHLKAEQTACLSEVEQLQRAVEHINVIVSAQQAHATTTGLLESFDVRDVLAEALQVHRAAMSADRVEIVDECFDAAPVLADRHKVQQILINLISNALNAMKAQPFRTLTLMTAIDPGLVRLSVRDTGCGIATANMTSIFSRGFTTRTDGHGFGLHSAALAAKALGGSLDAHSEGPGKGAQFTLALPLAKSKQVHRERSTYERSASRGEPDQDSGN